MFESAADNSSILSIDLGLLIGLLVLQRLLDPLLTRDRILFGVGMTPFQRSHFPSRISGSISSLRSKHSLSSTR